MRTNTWKVNIAVRGSLWSEPSEVMSSPERPEVIFFQYSRKLLRIDNFLRPINQELTSLMMPIGFIRHFDNDRP